MGCGRQWTWSVSGPSSGPTGGRWVFGTPEVLGHREGVPGPLPQKTERGAGCGALVRSALGPSHGLGGSVTRVNCNPGSQNPVYPMRWSRRASQSSSVLLLACVLLGQRADAASAWGPLLRACGAPARAARLRGFLGSQRVSGRCVLQASGRGWGRRACRWEPAHTPPCKQFTPPPSRESA